MPLDRYRVALREPGLARLMGTSLVARMPNGMSALAVLLLVTREHSYAAAGLVTGAYVAAAGVSNPLLSRAADRFGPRAVLLPTAVGYAAAITALALVPAGNYAAEVVAAIAMGLSSPPVVSVVRGSYSRLYPPEVATVAYGLEATAQELIFIVGPALVALVAGATDARVAAILTGALALGGTVACATSPAFATRPSRSERRRRLQLVGTRLPAYVLMGLAITVAFNMCDVAIVAFVSGRRASAAAGVVLACWSLGSLIGGLVFAARHGRADDDGLAWSVLAIAAGIGAAALAPGRVALAAILFVGGSTIAPGLARLYARVGAVAPPGASTEAFGWMAVGMLAGSSLGAAVGGLTVDAIGARMALVIAAAVPAIAAVGFLLWLRRARPAPAADPLLS